MSHVLFLDALSSAAYHLYMTPGELLCLPGPQFPHFWKGIYKTCLENCKTPLFNKYLLNACYVPVTILWVEDVAAKKGDKNPCPNAVNLHRKWGGEKLNRTIDKIYRETINAMKK